MTKMFVAQERSQNTKVVVNPLSFSFLVPGEGESDVFIGNSRLVFSNDAINAMIRESDIEILAIEEPQIAGVTDEDIVDETKPIALEDVVDENDIERDVDKVVEGTEDLVVEGTDVHSS